MNASITELKQRAKLPAKQAGGGTVAAFFEANKASMAAVLPKHVSTDRMLKIALGAIRTTPKLMDCTTESLFGAVVQCAQLGLEPNTPMGHAYLIPFSNRRANRTDVQVIIGYRGLLDLARRSGQIVSIAAHEVRQHDEFRFSYGLDEELHHRPGMGERGEIVAFYAVAKLVGGGHAFEVMSKAEVDRIRDASQGYQTAKRFNRSDNPWMTHYDQMGRKTLIRRLFKFLPVSIEMATASALDAMAEADKPQGLDDVLQGEFSVVPDDAPAVADDEDDPGPADAAQDPAVAARPAQEWPSRLVDRETGEETWTDSAGAFFDPKAHATGSDGTPSVNQDGTFRARRGTKAQPAPQNDAPPPAEDGDPGFGGLE